jgi:hypothetical protein
MVFVGLGIVVSGLVGAIVLPVVVFGPVIDIGSALIAGIIVSWLRHSSTFSRIPAPHSGS